VFFWIPAFAGMTAFAVINVAVYSLFMNPILFIPFSLTKGRGSFILRGYLHRGLLPTFGRHLGFPETLAAGSQ
jgi:hypothetical protein